MTDKIIRLREQGLTYKEIGEIMGLSLQRVFDIVHPEKIKAYQKTKKYQEYKKLWFREYRLKKRESC